MDLDLDMELGDLDTALDASDAEEVSATNVPKVKRERPKAETPAPAADEGELDFSELAQFADVDADDLQRQVDAVGEFKRVEPGNYTFQVVDIALHGTPSDPNWRTFKLTLECPAGELNQFVLAPLKTPFYKAKNGNDTLLLYKKLAELFAGFGVHLSTKADDKFFFGKVIPKFFGKDAKKAWSNVKFEAEVGYDGPHAIRQEDGQLIVARDKKATKFIEDVETGEPRLFPDFDNARLAAETSGLGQLAFAGIVSIKAKKRKG